MDKSLIVIGVLSLVIIALPLWYIVTTEEVTKNSIITSKDVDSNNPFFLMDNGEVVPVSIETFELYEVGDSFSYTCRVWK